MPIVKVPIRYSRLGRISLGYKKVRMENGQPVLRDGKRVTHPMRSKGFVFHSDNEERLRFVARYFGGSVEEAVTPDEEGGRWRVITPATEIECLLPAEDERAWDSWMERWGRRGLIRRCDGETSVYAIVDEKTGEVQMNVPCICAAQNLTGDARCDPVSRLNILIPSLYDAPGLGVWQVQSKGWRTFLTLNAAIDLLKRTGHVVGVPLTLRAEMQDTRSIEDGKMTPRVVPVIVLDTKLSIRSALAQGRQMEALVPGEVAALPEPDRSVAPIGADEPAQDDQVDAMEPGVDASDAYRREAARLEAEGRWTDRLQLAIDAPVTAAFLSQEELKSLSAQVTGKKTRQQYDKADYWAMVKAVEAYRYAGDWELAIREGKQMRAMGTAEEERAKTAETKEGP